MLAHVKELLEQTAATLKAMTDNVEIGIYSAGLKSRDLNQPIIVAGIQSVHKRAYEFGKIDLVIIDECHLIPTSGDGRYREFLKDLKTANPDVKLVGLTARKQGVTTPIIVLTANAMKGDNAKCLEAVCDGYIGKPIDQSKLVEVSGNIAEILTG